MKSRSKPVVQMIMRDGTLNPITRYDAEIMETYGNNQIFNVIAVTKDQTHTINYIGQY